MEQITLFKTGPGEAISIMKVALEAVVFKNFLSCDYLQFNERKNYYAISFKDALFAKIPKLKKKKRIDIWKDASTFESFDLQEWTDIYALIGKCSDALQRTIDSFPKEFSCCSRYVQCSDERACVHPDQSMRLGCYYRRVLASGQVFYGKNQTIS